MHKNTYGYYISNLLAMMSGRDYKGWGRKKSGKFALWCKKNFGGTVTLFEDGFIRSLGLGVEGSPSFSLVKDDIGIYYDATEPSQLEIILNTHDFHNDGPLIEQAHEAIRLINKYNISKYNNAFELNDEMLNIQGKYPWINTPDNTQKVLIVTQTASDESLVYGLAGEVNTRQIIKDAIHENPKASIFIKIHPDVLSGKKDSDININDIPKRCTIINEDINPISLLKHMDKIYIKTSGMGIEALMLGKTVVCYGLPYYAGWGLTQDKQSCHRRTRKLTMEELFAGAYILYTHYYNPYSQKKSDIIDTIKSIVKYRNIYRQNEGNLYFFGFSRWKRKFTTAFFPALKKNHIIFCASLEDAIIKGLDVHNQIYIWGKKPFPKVETYAKEKNIPLLRIEDGFVRSVSLGSDLTKAYSLVVDSRGIYFDPTQESDLEHLLNTYVFDDKLINRAKNLQRYLIENKISKYNIYQDKQLKIENPKKGQTVVVVPGQVEDDASILYGANGMTNLELLEQTRENRPDAYIIYKPHPDVLAGNRKGRVSNNIALEYCDTIITDSSIDSVLELADEVHTITSLVGFEALIRGRRVYTYGLPFYAGWGLTTDTKVCSRRTKKRTLDELVAAAFILYPRYIHPRTNVFCEIEILLKEIDTEKNRYNNNIFYKLYINSRNMISRKTQLLIKAILSE